MSTVFGKLIRSHREALGLSLLTVAEVVEISRVYLSEVERGIRPPLKRTRWDSLIRAVPTLNYYDLGQAAMVSRRLVADPKRIYPEVMRVLHSLIAAAHMGIITADEVELIRKIIQEAMRKSGVAEQRSKEE